MVAVSLTKSAPTGVAADVLIVGLRDGDDGVSVVGLAAAERDARTTLEAAFRAVGAKGAVGATTTIPGHGTSAQAVVGVGLGETVRGKARKHEALRRAAGVGLRAAVAGDGPVVVALGGNDADALAALAQGALLGSYRDDRFRGVSSTTDDTDREVLIAATSVDRAARTAVERAVTIGREVARARDLVNAPPSHLSPEDLASVAVSASQDLGLDVEVLDERELAEAGFGGISAVGQGSANAPRLVRLSYRPRGAKRHVALVGKGVTFDSGGLSLKPPQAMETMKCDMGGAAAVLGATLALAALKTKVNVTAYLPLVENMPSGTAQRPGDVITAYGGRTIEVLNTDAEGRLILCDALVRAQEDEPDVLIDVATLTGAQMVALGNQVAGAMGNDDATRNAVVDAGTAAGELLWSMPLPVELRASLDSPIADIKNIGDRYGGMLVAGLFLKEFVDDEQKWVHLDIAGPAFNEAGPRDYTPKGGTGFAVRTLVAYAETLAT